MNTQAELWAVIGELEEFVSASRVCHRAEELEALFADLTTVDAKGRRDTEDKIWSIWCDHPAAAARDMMAVGIGALSDGQLSQARVIFDRLVSNYPEWAEAWNKRATVLFLLSMDAESVADIRYTLRLEPRHFGALGGLAQIALRNGAPDAARAALRNLLRSNPNAAGVAEVIETIDRDAPTTVH